MLTIRQRLPRALWRGLGSRLPGNNMSGDTHAESGLVASQLVQSVLTGCWACDRRQHKKYGKSNAKRALLGLLAGAVGGWLGCRKAIGGQGGENGGEVVVGEGVGAARHQGVGDPA